MSKETMMNSELSGLYLCGIVEGRSKRYVDTKNGKKEVVTYKITSNKHNFYVDEWTPEGYHAVGEYVQKNVSVKAYVSKNGAVNTSYTVSKDVEFGESF